MKVPKYVWLMMVTLAFALLFSRQTALAQAGITKVCPSTGIQDRGASFTPGGIILTAFDKSAIWVYNIDSGRRYPLPETAPCASNCNLSPDKTSITFFN